MNEQHVYYYRFPGEPIGRYSCAFGYITHVCRVKWIDSQGEEGRLIGFASSEESAKRTALNLKTRFSETISGDLDFEPVEVLNVGKQPLPGVKGVDRFVKLLWKPKEMPKEWAKTLHFKGRYLVTGEGRHCWYVVIMKEEYKVSRQTGEIVWYDAKGLPVRGGPIFVKYF